MSLPNPSVEDWRPAPEHRTDPEDANKENSVVSDAEPSTLKVDSAAKPAAEEASCAQQGARVTLTDEDNRRICRKTDMVILPVLVWVYFLQILDKTMLGYSAIYGLQADTGLVANEYSLLGSIAPIAQLAWQPFSSVLIVKVRPRVLMPALVFGWGVAQTCMCAANNFGGLMAARFMLGLFEGGCLPLFTVITATWYRRAEQPLRIAAWYGTNGLATILGAAFSYGLGQIKSPVLASWQIIFLFTGLLTVVSVPLIAWKLDDDPSTARFLTAEERAMAVERLRANQAGSETREIKWNQVLEAFLDPKVYLFFVMSFCNNLGAQVTNVFGPLILNGLGFRKHITALLNMPFGALQYLIIVFVAWAAIKFRWKSLTLGAILLPIIVGLVMLLVIRRTPGDTGVLLLGYYLLAFIFGCNTLIVSWCIANTAGQTKKSAIMSIYNAAAALGNIVGPVLFRTRDAPKYAPGLKATLGVYIALFWAVVLQVANLVVQNRAQERRRVALGKPAKIHDHSMEERYTEINVDNDVLVGQLAFADLTDKQNDEFVYVY